MCLQTLTKKYARPSRKVVKAWKIVERFDGGLITPFLFTKIVTGEWMKAKAPTFQDGEPCLLKTEAWGTYHRWENQVTYPWGFHVFAKKEDADKALTFLSNQKNRFVVPVEITNIVAEGTDGTSSGASYPRAFNYVARKMRLL